MKIRSDSLFAELGRANLRDDFFAWFAVATPSYAEMVAWLAERGVKSSLAALHNLVTVHYAQWRIQKSIEAADAEALSLPDNVDQVTRDRIRGLRLDLAMRDITVDQALSLIRLDQDREKNEIAGRKLALLEAREAKLNETISDPSLTPEEQMAKFKAILGVK